MAKTNKILLILGNQLFPPELLDRHRDALIVMVEDRAACTYLRHHQHKLMLILSAMRAYAEGLRRLGFNVRYEALTEASGAISLIEHLAGIVRDSGAQYLVHFEFPDRPVARRIHRLAERLGLERIELESPMFLTSRAEFAAWREKHPTPRMADFYRWQRQRLGVLVRDNGKPVGGRWSFDRDNRKRLPNGIAIPELPRLRENRHVAAVRPLMQAFFADHPGRAADFALPVTRRQARTWLRDFLDQRFTCFGDYEDALTTRSDHVFHSVLSPLMNIGLLTPDEVVDETLRFADDEAIALNNVEGFIRQVIGWREFMFGIYCTDGRDMLGRNFWRHHRQMTPDWYAGTTGILPFDCVIDKANRIGWAHHIERLMIAGNMMLLAEIHPRDVYRWFMELFVDSAEWVMVPNVYGMALFADGGTFTTKPYVCGSNYWRKMGDYPTGDWTTTVDALFWRFIAKHRDFFAAQPRLGMLCGNLDRQTAERRRELARAARLFLDTKTQLPPKAA